MTGSDALATGENGGDSKKKPIKRKNVRTSPLKEDVETDFGKS